MKIGPTDGNVPLIQVVGDKPASSKPAGPRPDAAISFSNLSTQLHSLEANVASAGPVDMARVEAIKRAIQSGQFKVNPDLVADKLIASVKEMLGK